MMKLPFFLLLPVVKSNNMIRVQKEDFNISDEIALLNCRNVGALASFVGLVRDCNNEIKAMTLEHYPGMTEKKLAEIEIEARNRWNLEDCLIVHRYGRLKPGDNIVMVIAASPHRQAALEACAFLIDWLKTSAPFWKYEEKTQGAEWVKARTADTIASKKWTTS